MKDIVHVFVFELHEIRFIDGLPVANDVAAVLGYKDPAAAISKKVKPKNKGVARMETPGGNQAVTVLHEAGIYQLIFSSKLDSAQRFQDWVFEEVLPSIRKTGSYSTKKRPVERLVSIEDRRALTDSTKEYIERHPEMSKSRQQWLYSNMTNRLYLDVFSLQAKDLTEVLGCNKSNLRDHFSLKELGVISAVETTASRLIDKYDMYPIDAIKEAVSRTEMFHLFATEYAEAAMKIKQIKAAQGKDKGQLPSAQTGG